jgi:hypothetical protein
MNFWVLSFYNGTSNQVGIGPWNMIQERINPYTNLNYLGTCMDWCWSEVKWSGGGAFWLIE